LPLKFNTSTNTELVKPIPGTLQQGGASFQTTHWTLILPAQKSEQKELSQQALSDFCNVYWPSLYAFLRGRGYSSPDAQDYVQGFFTYVLAEGTLSRADQEKEKLRTRDVFQTPCSGDGIQAQNVSDSSCHSSWVFFLDCRTPKT